MSQLKEAIRQRIGWEPCLRPFLHKELPSNLGWSATLGSLCALLFVVMAVSGMFLAMYYNPSPDKAYQSIDYIMKEVSLGPVLRGIHHWGAGAMVLAVFVHLATVFFSGSFKAPRELTWILGVCLFLVTLGLGFTGLSPALGPEGLLGDRGQRQHSQGNPSGGRSPLQASARRGGGLGPDAHALLLDPHAGAARPAGAPHRRACLSGPAARGL